MTNNILRIYLEFLVNIFNILILFHYAYASAHKKPNYKFLYILLGLQFLYSIPEHIPGNLFLNLTTDFLIIFLIGTRKLKTSLKTFIKYECFVTFTPPIIYFTHSIALKDFDIILDSEFYGIYKDLICISAFYIFYTLYLNSKKMKLIRATYLHYFNFILGFMIMFISYVSLYSLKQSHSSSDTLPLMFSLVYFMMLAFLYIYGKMIDVLQENAIAKIQLEQNSLTAEYGAYLEENLETLRRISHDIRNHLTLIDGYASHNECDKIHDYINKIFDGLTQTKLIQTPSPALTILLNAKYQEAKHQDIKCDFICNFGKIFVNDFHLITIFGNLLDNAILAASKVENKFVRLSICQLDSHLEIHIENNHKEHIREKGGIFLSTKSDKSAISGIGIKNVREAVKSLHGRIDIKHTESNFNVTILLPNYESDMAQCSS